MKNNQQEIILLQDLGMLYPNENSKNKVRYGIFQCVCNSEFKAQVQDVKRKHTTSCGCLKNKSKITHNLTKHKLYNIWRNIKDRCTNIKHKSYNDYGGRGITICDEWKTYIPFGEWARANGYQDNLTIDRIDVNGNYEPSNCRWVDNFVQARNTRKLPKNNTSGYRGVSLHKITNKWSAIIGVNKKKIKIGYFKTAEEGARAYDKYVIDNNLEHPTNFKREDK